jgi:hypothetical protein
MQKLINRKSRIQKPSTGQRSNPYAARAFRYVRNIVVFLAFFIITTTVIHDITNRGVPGGIASISPKYEYFAAHKNNYDTLFLGSSVLYRHLDPATFDAAMQDQTLNQHPDRQLDNHSFNFGVGGMRLFENRFLLRELMELKPENLRWVFIETNLEGLAVESENIRKQRVIYYHDLPSLFMGVNYILGTDRAPSEKIQLLYQYIVPTFYHAVNLGVFSDLVFWQHRWNWDFASQLGSNFNGYIPLDAETEKSFIDRRENFVRRNENNPNSNYLKRVENTKAIIQRLESKRDRAQPLPPQKVAMLREMVQMVEAQGAHPIFLIPPALYKPKELRAQEELMLAQRDGIIPVVLDFRDPDQYPELYEIGDRFDGRYLNNQGAQRFSQILAQEFDQMLNSSPSWLQATDK